MKSYTTGLKEQCTSILWSSTDLSLQWPVSPKTKPVSKVIALRLFLFAVCILYNLQTKYFVFSFCSGQIILGTLCAFLMKTRKVWLFSAHMLPLLARLCAAPHATLLTVNTFAMGLTGSGIAMFLLSNLFVPYRLARAVYSELLQVEVSTSSETWKCCSDVFDQGFDLAFMCFF